MSQYSDISDDSQRSNDNTPDIKRPRVETYDSQGSIGSGSSWGTVFSENNAAVFGLVKPGSSILKPTSGSKKVNTDMPPNPISEAFLPLERKANRDARWSHENADASNDIGYVLERRQRNGPNNQIARSGFIQSDAELRRKIIKMFEQWEEDNPPADAVVRIDESKNTFGTAKRESMGTNVVTVDQDRREKASIVADKVSDILFELLKDIPVDQVNRKMDELIDKASQVNTSLNKSSKLTSRQLQHLYDADLFEKAIEMTLTKLNSHKMSYTGQLALYTKGIIDSVKDKLLYWLFGGASVGGYSRSKTIKRNKRRSDNKRRSIKRRSKKSIKRSIKRRRSKKKNT